MSQSNSHEGPFMLFPLPGCHPEDSWSALGEHPGRAAVRHPEREGGTGRGGQVLLRKPPQRCLRSGESGQASSFRVPGSV